MAADGQLFSQSGCLRGVLNWAKICSLPAGTVPRMDAAIDDGHQNFGRMLIVARVKSTSPDRLRRLVKIVQIAKATQLA